MMILSVPSYLKIAKKIFGKPLKIYLSRKRRFCDYLGSLKVNEYSNSSKIIRNFRDNDLEGILKLYIKNFENIDCNQIVNYSKQFRKTFYIYEIKGAILGYLGCYVHLGCAGLKIVQKATIYSFAVDEHMRGKGIGSSVLRESILQLRNNGVQSIYLYARLDNVSALNLYRKTGFKAIEKINEKEIKMELKLISG